MQRIVICSFIWQRFTPELYKSFLTKKGKECYFYNMEKIETGSDYIRLEIGDPRLEHRGYTVTTKDYGPRVKLIPDPKFPGSTTKLWNLENTKFKYDEIKRDDPDLVALVEPIIIAEPDDHCMFRIIEIPDGVKWYIREDCGCESVEEEHRTWR